MVLLLDPEALSSFTEPPLKAKSIPALFWLLARLLETLLVSSCNSLRHLSMEHLIRAGLLSVCQVKDYETFMVSSQ